MNTQFTEQLLFTKGAGENSKILRVLVCRKCDDYDACNSLRTFVDSTTLIWIIFGVARMGMA